MNTAKGSPQARAKASLAAGRVPLLLWHTNSIFRHGQHPHQHPPLQSPQNQHPGCLFRAGPNKASVPLFRAGPLRLFRAGPLRVHIYYLRVHKASAPLFRAGPL